MSRRARQTRHGAGFQPAAAAGGHDPGARHVPQHRAWRRRSPAMCARKQRALHAAVVAEQYAEWWLSGNATASIAPAVCDASADINVVPTAVLICSNAINPTPALLAGNPQNVPWTDGSGHSIGFTFHPNSGATAMSFTPGCEWLVCQYLCGVAVFLHSVHGTGRRWRWQRLQDRCRRLRRQPLSVAVVESMYEIGASVKCLSCQ